jgi:hypothetical protein
VGDTCPSRLHSSSTCLLYICLEHLPIDPLNLHTNIHTYIHTYLHTDLHAYAHSYICIYCISSICIYLHIFMRLPQKRSIADWARGALLSCTHTGIRRWTSGTGTAAARAQFCVSICTLQSKRTASKLSTWTCAKNKAFCRVICAHTGAQFTRFTSTKVRILTVYEWQWKSWTCANTVAFCRVIFAHAGAGTQSTCFTCTNTDT